MTMRRRGAYPTVILPSVQTEYYPMKGGLDLQSPAIEMYPGKCFDAQNYEPAISGGYRRINGYDRSDGRTAPTGAAYWVMTIAQTGTIANGNTVTGASSGATGKVLGVYGTVLVLGRVSGTYTVGENLQIAAATIATATTTAVQSGASSTSDDADYALLAANDRRADILVVPGSGQIRGVFVYNDVVYAFRDNAGATAGDLYKQTSGGWSKIALGREIQFTTRAATVTITIAAPGVGTWTAHGLSNGQTITLSTTGALPTGLAAATTYYIVSAAANTFQLALTSGGAAITTSGSQSGTHTATLTSGTAIAVGNTVTGSTSGATAVVAASLLRSGTWSASPRGTLVFASVTGTFSSGEALQVGGLAQVQTSTADTAITRAVGGRVEAVIANFTGSTATEKVYGADGVNLAFEFDGTTYVPIRTGMTTDTPVHVIEHKGYLFLSFLGSIQLSSVGAPYSWTAVTGALEISTGSACTGFVMQTGNATSASLLIFTKNKTFVLYGSSSTTFTLVPSNNDLGYAAYTMQLVGNNTFGLTARGVQSVVTTLNYGDFDYSAISFPISSLMATKVGLETASVTLKTKDQYRVFFSDNSAIVVGLSGGKVTGLMRLDYGRVVRCITSAKLTTGEEVTYFGSDDGYVYKDNVGTSFDGAVIDAFIRPAFNNLKSPRMRKRFRRATFEVKAEGFASVSVSYDLGYANPNVNPATSRTTTLTGAGAYWDQLTWDSFTWDTQVFADPSISIEGTEKNIAFFFYSSRAQDYPHTVQGVVLSYTAQRQER